MYLPSLLSSQILLPELCRLLLRTVTFLPQLSKAVGLVAGTSKRPGEQLVCPYCLSLSPPAPEHSSPLLYLGTRPSLRDESAGLQREWGGRVRSLPCSTISPSCCIRRLRVLTLRAILLAFTALYFMRVYGWCLLHHLRSSALKNPSA